MIAIIKFIVYYILTVLVTINGKSITIQMDSEDFIKIINHLTNLKLTKNPTVRSDVIKPEVYKNPYHPEDGVNETEKDSIKAYNNNKTIKNISIDKKNDEVNAKIDQDNMEFLQTGNNISDDESNGNNTSNDLKLIKKNSFGNFTLKENVFVPTYSKRFIKKHQFV